jgi:hypothetical protein
MNFLPNTNEFVEILVLCKINIVSLLQYCCYAAAMLSHVCCCYYLVIILYYFQNELNSSHL